MSYYQGSSENVSNLPDRFKIVYFGKEVKNLYHLMDILPQYRNIQKYHHLISPFMYKKD